MPEFIKALLKFFHGLCNERGDVNNGEPEPEPNPDDTNPAGTGEPNNPNPEAQPQIDWEQDTNPYRKRYQDSQSQIQPLVRTLQQFAEYDHATKSWKPKTGQAAPQAQTVIDDIEKELEQYDPKFRAVLRKFVEKQITDKFTKFQQESNFASDYNLKASSARSKSLEEFGSEFEFAKNGKYNFESPLYKLANQIIIDKYAEFNPDGTFHRYTTPDAEYLATVEAYAILKKKEKQQPQGKEKFNAINGKGSKAAGVKEKLSDEEYSKLSDAEKDSYDASEQGV